MADNSQVIIPQRKNSPSRYWQARKQSKRLIIQTMILEHKAHIVFWITSILVLIDGFIIHNSNLVLDINVQDTYYVIEHGLIAEIFAFIFFILGLGYWIIKILKIKLNQYLTFIHIIGSVVLLYIYRIIIEIAKLVEINIAVLNLILALAIVLLIVVQPVYIVNLFIGFRKSRASQ